MIKSEPHHPFASLDDGITPRAWRSGAAKVEQFVGVIRLSPRDYSDARYFVERAIATSSSSVRELSVAPDLLPGIAQTVTATNLAELPAGTHLLPAGTVVHVFVLYARSSGAKVYVFNQPTVQSVVVQITDVEADGEYAGKILGGASNASSAVAFTMPAGMTLPANTNALILNVEEDSQTGHRLKTGSYAIGVVKGMTSESPPRSIVVIRGGMGRSDSPTTLGSAVEGSETADGATWSQAANATPVNLYVITRVVYNAAGDQVLYSFARMLSFDARGLLLSIGAETRIAVDATEACS